MQRVLRQSVRWAFLFLLVCPGPVVRSAEPEGATRRTAHYHLYIEALDIDEVADYVEQFHAKASAFFGGKSPAESQLSVAVFATAQRFHDALAAEGQPVVEAGGYYSPDRKKVYLFVQPSAYFTRQLLLHELAHQFHFLAACDNHGP